MKILLALICFIAMMLHSFFGYFLYVRGETVFEPENMVVAVEKKAEPKGNKFDIFKKKSAHIEDPVVHEQAKNAAFYEKPDDGLVKTEETQKANDSEKLIASAENKDSEATETSSESTNKIEAADSVADTNQAPAPQAQTEYFPFNTGWSGFLQVENAIIASILFFLGFAVCCVKGRGPASRWVFGFNFIFWGTLSGAIWFFHPENTPLMIFNIKFGFQQWYLVICLTGLGALLSFLLFLNAFRSPIDSKPTKTLPQVNEPSMVEPKTSRFGFGKKKSEVNNDKPVLPENKNPEDSFKDKSPE